MKISKDIEEFLNKNTTRAFLGKAKDFIELIESENIKQELFIKQAHSILIDLYSAGHKLEEIELKYSSSKSEFEILDDEFFRIKRQNITSSLGKECFYWEIFDPTYTETDEGAPGPGWKITDREASQGWLVDDFGDIYRDLKIGIEQLNLATDEAIEDALWEMKWSYNYHWGNHCINALRYLHYLLKYSSY